MLGREEEEASTTLSCPTEVEEYRFKQAVIDNFAPIQDQKYWEGIFVNNPYR